MANEKNLVPFDKLTEKEQREIASKGGKASVEARREKKTIKKEIEIAMENGDFGERIGLALLNKSADGDVAATKLLLELLGEYQQQQKVDLNLPDITLVKSKCKKK